MRDQQLTTLPSSLPTTPPAGEVSRFEKYRPKPVPTIRRYAAVNLGVGVLGLILVIGTLLDDKAADPLVVLVGVLLILTGWGGMRTLTELRHLQLKPRPVPMCGKTGTPATKPPVPAPDATPSAG